MRQSELVRAFAAEAGCPVRKARRLLEYAARALFLGMVRDKVVWWRAIGTFKVTQVTNRNGRGHMVTLKLSDGLRRALRECLG